MLNKMVKPHFSNLFVFFCNINQNFRYINFATFLTITMYFIQLYNCAQTWQKSINICPAMHANNRSNLQGHAHAKGPMFWNPRYKKLEMPFSSVQSRVLSIMVYVTLGDRVLTCKPVQTGTMIKACTKSK